MFLKAGGVGIEVGATPSHVVFCDGSEVTALYLGGPREEPWDDDDLSLEADLDTLRNADVTRLVSLPFLCIAAFGVAIDDSRLSEERFKEADIDFESDFAIIPDTALSSVVFSGIGLRNSVCTDAGVELLYPTSTVERHFSVGGGVSGGIGPRSDKGLGGFVFRMA